MATRKKKKSGPNPYGRERGRKTDWGKKKKKKTSRSG